MTIDDMPAGREMDALVAEKVMGYEHCKDPAEYWGIPDAPKDNKNWKHYSRIFFGDPPKFSTDIAAAWEVVEKLDGYARDEFHDIMGDECAMRDLWELTSKKAALTICYAALQAVGYEPERNPK